MKKILSIFLSFVMVAASLTMSASVFAADAKTAKVEISAQAEGEFISEPVEITVSASLSDEYSEAIGFKDSSDEPTVLDAAIAAHLEFMGEDFMEFAPLSIAESGWITDFFGLGGNLYYYCNGVSLSSLTETISDGDYLEFDFLSDTVNWSDLYVSADARSKAAYTGVPVEMTFTANSWSGSMPAANLTITVDGEAAGTTDENGKITLKLDDIGAHCISSSGTLSGTPVFKPWCVVNVSSKLYDYVNQEMKKAAEYLTANSTEFTVSNASDFLVYLRSGADMSKFADGFVQDVKNNLNTNEGRLLGKQWDYSANDYVNVENISYYAVTALCLEELGYDAEDFEGYNLIEAIETADLNTLRPHQYYYKYAVEAVSDEYAKVLIKDLISNYYTLGKGMSNWGYSCDNTAHFLITVAPYADEFKEYADDAKALIKTYLKEKGAYSDELYVPQENADSTALSMAAFAVAGDTASAFSYYKLLAENFEGNTGIFQLDGKDNAYATKDALLSLEYFKNTIEENSYEHPEHIWSTVTTPATAEKEGSIVRTCKICGERKTEILPKLAPEKSTVTVKPTTLKSVKKGKKRFTAVWKKVSGVTGYQLQYSTSKKFKKGKNTKTVTVKKAKTTKKTVKKLKSKKRYYVRVRTYKIVDGKKVYSKWSKVKKVKTK